MKYPKQMSLFPVPRKSGAPLKKTEENIRRAVFLYSLGIPLRDIGAVLGISYEYIRSMLKEAGVTAEHKQLALWRKQESIFEDKALAWLEALESRYCVVCDKLITVERMRYPATKTCSTECADAWTHLRHHTSSGYKNHRAKIAKSILKNSKNENYLRYAQRILDGTAEIKGSWYIKGSKAEAYAKKFNWIDEERKSNQPRKEVEV